MDPNATLNQLRVFADNILEFPNDYFSHIIRAAEQFKALDNWLSKGGSFPKDWEK